MHKNYGNSVRPLVEQAWIAGDTTTGDRSLAPGAGAARYRSECGSYAALFLYLRRISQPVERVRGYLFLTRLPKASSLAWVKVTLVIGSKRLFADRFSEPAPYIDLEDQRPAVGTPANRGAAASQA